MAPQRNAGAGAEAEFPEYAGHYRLESCLGSGGMGIVHLARSTSGMRLAVKVVHAEFARDPEFRGRFRQEVAAARRVSGAFTAPVVDADPEGERPWMATLFIPGPTLAEHVKRNGPMDAAQLRRLMAGLAEALRDIHRVGVVHRDLKPSNVLLADDGPKVIDFGISRPKDSELRTETGKLIGTPPFMAPEQFRRPREVGPAADVFALGSVLVHAATGRGPFDSDSPYVVAYQVVHDEPDLSDVPDELAPLVLRCLAKEPEDRPTPDELMHELRSVAASYNTQAFIPAQRTAEAEAAPAEVQEGAADRRPGDGGAGTGTRKPPGHPSGRARRRPGKRAVIGVGGGIGLAVVGALLALSLFDGGGAGPENAAPRTTPAAFSAWATRPAAGPGTPQCAYGEDALLCAQGRQVFAISPTNGDVLWRHPVSGPPRTEPPVVSGGLVYTSPGSGSSLESLDPATGEVRRRRGVPEFNSMAAAGDMLLLTAPDGTVSGVDGAAGDTKWRITVPGHEVPPRFVSFGGDPLAYATSVSGDGRHTRVTALDPRTGEVRRHTELDGDLELVGTSGGDAVLLAPDTAYGEVRSVFHQTPGTGRPERITLPVPVQHGRGAVHGDVVHLSGDGGAVVAVDLVTGRQLWRLESSVSRSSVPVSDGRHVYVTAPDGRLLAADARSGEIVGQTPPRLGPDPGLVMANLPRPVVVGDTVYATAPDGTVFAVDGRQPSAW